MDLTTVERVKAVAESFTGPAADAKLAIVLASTSVTVEKALGRELKYEARTAIFDVEPGIRHFFLLGFPAIVITDVRYDITGVFASDSVIDNTDQSQYTINYELGAVVFNTDFAACAPRSLKVTYTGGYHTSGITPETFAVNAPDIAFQVAKQVAHDYKRSRGSGYSSESMRGASVSFDIPAERGLLREVYDALLPYKSQALRR